ncbi:MAG: hypothetical protein ABIU30_22950 [Ferruginibacter sp.]
MAAFKCVVKIGLFLSLFQNPNTIPLPEKGISPKYGGTTALGLSRAVVGMQQR